MTSAKNLRNRNRKVSDAWLISFVLAFKWNQQIYWFSHMPFFEITKWLETCFSDMIAWVCVGQRRATFREIEIIRLNLHLCGYTLFDTKPFIYRSMAYNFTMPLLLHHEHTNISKIYLTTARPVLEYAVSVWYSVPSFLSDTINSIQKRALKLILPAAVNPPS